MLLHIDFLQYKDQLKIKQIDAQPHLYDPIRKKFLRLSPEELVRQLLLHYLINELNYNKQRISLERQLMVNERERRFDVLVYRTDMEPFLLVECKAPNVPLQQSTFEQVVQYNLPLQVPYLLITNGIRSYCCMIDYLSRDYQFLDQLPLYPSEI